VDPVNDAVKGDLQKLTAAVVVAGRVGPSTGSGQGTGGAAYVMDGRLNDSFRAVNMLVDKGVAVKRVDTPADATMRAGDFVVAAGSEAVLADVAKATGVDFTAIKAAPAQGAHDVKRMRIGMYQRYGGGNMDEGWTRWLLEQWGYPYTSIMDAEVKKGGLEAKYDAIIIPDDSTAQITGERPPAGAGGGPGGGGGFGGGPESVPPEYRSGIGREGVDALKAFVQKGGTLITLGNATAFAIDRFALPVRNVLAGKPTKEFFCPGSTLHAIFDNKNPLGYGMPSEGLVLFWSNQAFEIAPTDANENYEIVVRYPGRDLLQSGWLIGEDLLFNKAAMISAKVGQGKVVLIGLRPQARATTHATFKLLFNTLVK